MQIVCAPGVALVLPSTDKSPSGIISGVSKKGRIMKGNIVEMGPDDMTNSGAIVKADNYGKKGDTIYFLSYYEEGGYDQVKIDNVQYYLVKFGDFRLNIK